MDAWMVRAGLIGAAAGVLGALSAVVLLVWPPQVSEELLSYPLTVSGFYVAQAWFFVHHLGLVVVLVGLILSGALGAGRFGRLGAWVAVAGMVALTFTELLAMRYAHWDNDAANAGLMGTSYGISVTAIGVGMIVTGIAAVRAGVWSGWSRWTPLAIGVAAFAVVTPAMFGGFVAARLGIPVRESPCGRGRRRLARRSTCAVVGSAIGAASGRLRSCVTRSCSRPHLEPVRFGHEQHPDGAFVEPHRSDRRTRPPHPRAGRARAR